MKILAIDDETLILRALQRAFEKGGHEITTTSRGQEGLRLWKKLSPDIVFLDILMPEMSGLEVLEKMSGQKKACVVLMSAYSSDYDEVFLSRYGADAFISKPFDDIFLVVKKAEELLL